MTIFKARWDRLRMKFQAHMITNHWETGQITSAQTKTWKVKPSQK